MNAGADREKIKNVYRLRYVIERVQCLSSDLFDTQLRQTCVI
jgi:hypothetical protein